MNSILRRLLVFVVLTAAGFAADDFAATKKKETPSSSAKASKSAIASSSEAVAASAAPTSGHDVVITSSKVCQAFKTRATIVETAVKAAKGSVVVNEEKAEGRNPDRGTFRIVAKGKTIVDLPGMARPFPAMKALDMEAIAKQTVAALK